MDIKLMHSQVDAIEDKIIDFRRDVHKHPEIAFETHRTAELIANRLEEFGYYVRRNAAISGVVADLKKDFDGDTLLLRADIDALELQELNDVEYKSTVDGKMHACGHDAHAAMLLGAAEVIIKHKDEIDGNIRFVFQPCEETARTIDGELTWGGRYMVKHENVMKNVNMCFALHINDHNPTGTISYNKKEATAASAGFTITFKGKGTHTSTQNLGTDSILMAAEFITQVQRIPMKELDPYEVCVLNIGMINGGTARNIVPETTQIVGGFRTYSTETTAYIWKSIEDKLEGVKRSFGGDYILKSEYESPPTINDSRANLVMKNGAGHVFDEESVIEIQEKGSLGGEDFAEYSIVKPGCMAWLGAAGDTEKESFIHNGKFCIDEKALALGSKTFIGVVYEYFKRD